MEKRLRFYMSRTTVASGTYLLPPPALSGQSRTFDPGGSQGRFHACPFLGTWRALLCGEVVCVGAAAGDDLQRFWED